MHKARAFTLIELLVVIAIIALLMGIMWHRAFVPTEPQKADKMLDLPVTLI